MQKNQFLLYGANGYTGELIARYAAEYGLEAVLAGRRESALKQMAAKCKLPYKVFDLSDTPALVAALREVKVVIHAAGPFDQTAKPMIDACMKTGTSYLDINGDMDVFELLHSYDEAAKRAGIMVMSGAGFDVVPTDCLALFLKNKMPDASLLQIAFATPAGGMSQGTAITSAQKLGEPGATRRDGKIVPEPLGKKGMWVDFPGGKRLFVMSLPWGDIFTAGITTGIPNIESYTAVPQLAYRFLKLQSLFNWLLRTSFVKSLAVKIIKKRSPGPDDLQRHAASSLVWGRAVNKGGKEVKASLSGPDAYTLTAYSTLLIAKKVLEGNFTAGYQTPAGAYGEDLVLEITGVQRSSS